MHLRQILAEGTGSRDGPTTRSSGPSFHCHIAWHVSSGLFVNIVERPDSIASQAKIPSDVQYACTHCNAFIASVSLIRSLGECRIGTSAVGEEGGVHECFGLFLASIYGEGTLKLPCFRHSHMNIKLFLLKQCVDSARIVLEN
jgi:hypothetical protein